MAKIGPEANLTASACVCVHIYMYVAIYVYIYIDMHLDGGYSALVIGL